MHFCSPPCRRSLSTTSIFQASSRSKQDRHWRRAAWDPKLGILTSGLDGNIHRWSLDSKASIHRKDAGTNGLLFDRDGSLLACEPKRLRITRTSPTGELKVLTDSFGGKNYNQPLYITGGGVLYSVRTVKEGRVLWPKK